MRALKLKLSPGLIAPSVLRFLPHGGEGGGPFERGPGNRSNRRADELPYAVEIWDQGKVTVERVLAVTTSRAIAFAAYFAAARDHPDRYITVRHKGQMLARWEAPEE